MKEWASARATRWRLPVAVRARRRHRYHRGLGRIAAAAMTGLVLFVYFFCSTNPTLAIKSNRVDWNLERGRRCSREVEDYPSLNRSIIRQLPVASLPARIKQDQAPWIPNSTCRQRWEISVQPIGESVAWFPSQRPIPNRILPTGKSKWTASDASMIWSRLILTSSKPTSERNLNQPISHFISLLPLEI